MIESGLTPQSYQSLNRPPTDGPMRLRSAIADAKLSRLVQTRRPGPIPGECTCLASLAAREFGFSHAAECPYLRTNDDTAAWQSLRNRIDRLLGRAR